jgi:hypothetical protein
MIKRKKVIISIILLIITSYCGMYYYKIIRYKIYDSAHQFGRENSYIFSKFYHENGTYPNKECASALFVRACSLNTAEKKRR